MKRNGLVIIETLLSIIIVVVIFFLIFNVYFIFKGFGKDILYINDKNRDHVKEIIEKSQYYDNNINFNNVKKIQYFLAFNNMEFTVYNKDGTTKVIYDDGLDGLREYIEENGYNEGKMFVSLGIIGIFICIGINKIRKETSNKIDLIDKEE